MKIKYFVVSFFLGPIFIAAMEQPEHNWIRINLPNAYIYPCDKKPCGNIGTNVYSTQFPTAEKSWFLEADCDDKYRMTSIRWVSDKISKVKGISFKGLVYKQNLGKPQNEFALFFHENRCYDGGGEYGWVIKENAYEAFFYLCGNCNLKEQKWCQWPGDESKDGICKSSGDCSAVKEALKNPAVYRYLNIKVKKDGSFLIELIDPVTFKSSSCKIKKPSWFKNLYDKNGYLTINAQKGAGTTVHPAPFMHVDEVKVYK